MKSVQENFDAVHSHFIDVCVENSDLKDKIQPHIFSLIREYNTLQRMCMNEPRHDIEF